jgi:hypothetical protein
MAKTFPGMVKLGHVALDGTKVKANASKRKAMSSERMPLLCTVHNLLKLASRRL